MKKEIALVLGGGGAKGLAHIGAIRALEELGYSIKEVVGTSIGALVGGAYCAGGLDEMEKKMRSMTKTDYLKLVDFTLGKEGWVKGDRIFEIMEKEIISDQNVGNLSIPFTAIATDLNSNEIAPFRNGSLFQAIRASISIPEFFVPVHQDGMKLVDGGLLSPLPIEFVQNKDLPVFAVNLSGKPTAKAEVIKESSENRIIPKIHLPSLKIVSVDILTSSIELMLMKISEQTIELRKPEQVISIPWNSCLFHEFYKAESQIELGYTIAIQQFKS
ncbi:patatin-like phospholipase family protein [Halosquirtibacter laminarini]|uniref:Patatin-like phospholipase family protein n=1 Tax=Halosquirtibacter laminarini TaxID=3374600 RepID=A0AC61NEA3_9BACT|nr:patatin-like phospholipase family protein [Prolixibacteraceae bacterium]